MIHYFKTALLMAFVLFIASSCNKKAGCTDSNATNYCSDCKKDDGTCDYERVVQHVFWFDQATSDSLTAHGYSVISCVNVPNGQEPYNGMPLYTSVSRSRCFSSMPIAAPIMCLL